MKMARCASGRCHDHFWRVASAPIGGFIVLLEMSVREPGFLRLKLRRFSGPPLVTVSPRRLKPRQGHPAVRLFAFACRRERGQVFGEVVARSSNLAKSVSNRRWRPCVEMWRSCVAAVAGFSPGLARHSEVNVASGRGCVSAVVTECSVEPLGAVRTGFGNAICRDRSSSFGTISGSTPVDATTVA